MQELEQHVTDADQLQAMLQQRRREEVLEENVSLQVEKSADQRDRGWHQEPAGSPGPRRDQYEVAGEKKYAEADPALPVRDERRDKSQVDRAEEGAPATPTRDPAEYDENGDEKEEEGQRAGIHRPAAPRSFVSISLRKLPTFCVCSFNLEI